MCSFVAPRPIALVTTSGEAGIPNAAPMSFFNVFSQDPPIVILGIQTRPDGTEKDTMRNIRRNGEFVVNMCDAALAQQMVDCGHRFAEDVSEVELTGLSRAASRKVSPPRVAEAPAALECRVERLIEYTRRVIVLGEVVQMHVRDTCLDATGRHIQEGAYHPVARLHADNYIVADQQFVLTESNDLAGRAPERDD